VPPDVKLARPEWSVLRGALGRPRRLSLGFLRQERARLELYRCALVFARMHARARARARVCVCVCVCVCARTLARV
jgi:hypothetical protein